MTDKLTRQVNENRQKAEENISAKISKTALSAEEQKSLIRLGGVGAVGRIAQTLTAQTIRGLQTIRDEKDFEALGFSRFDDYLDESDVSPMSYRQFNEREKLLLQEGDEVFDLLNNLKISSRQRKMLGAGNVQLDGQVAFVTTLDANGEEKTEEIEITDRARLLQTLSAVADQAAMLNAKVNKQREKIERGETEIESLQKKLDAGDFTGKGETAHFVMSMETMSALNKWTEFVKKLPLDEKVDFEEKSLVYLRSLNSALSRLASAYGHTKLKIGFDEDAADAPRQSLMEMSDQERENFIASKVGNVEENEFAGVTSNLDDDELAALID